MVTNEIIFYNKKRVAMASLDIGLKNIDIEIDYLVNQLFYQYKVKQKGYAYRNDKLIVWDDPSYCELWQTENSCTLFVCRKYFRFRRLSPLTCYDQINDPYIREQQIAPSPMIDWYKVSKESFLGSKRNITIGEFYNKYKK